MVVTGGDTTGSAVPVDSGRTLAHPGQGWHRETVSSRLAALAAGTAAVAHALAAPEHVSWWWPAGVLLILLALGQGAMAVICLRGGAVWQILAAIAGTVAAVAAHAWSRTYDLPLAPPFPDQAVGIVLVPGHDVHSGGGGSMSHAVGGIGNGVPLYNLPSRMGLESVGLLDGLAVLAEVGFIVAAVAMLGGALRSRAVDLLLVVGLIWWAMRFAGLTR